MHLRAIGLFLLLLAATSYADYLAVNGSDATGGFEPNLNNWTSYGRIVGLPPLGFTFNSQNIVSGTVYQGATSYQETVAVSGPASATPIIYESGLAFGPFYQPMNESWSWNFTGAAYFNKTIMAGELPAIYTSVSMCINFNVTNASLTGIIFHYCKYLNVSTGFLVNTTTDKFYEFDRLNATTGIWFNINRTNLTADFNSYLGAYWNVSNVTATQIINVVLRGTNNNTWINLFDAINISGTYITHVLVNLSSPTNAYNTSNQTIDFNFSLSSVDATGLINASLFVWNMTNNATPLISPVPFIKLLMPAPRTNNITITIPYALVNISWNIQGCTTAGYCDFNESNRSLYLDALPPLVNLSSPVNATATTNTTINFNFTVFEHNPKNASLWANFTGSWAFVAANQTATKPHPQQNNITWNITQGVGEYIWNIQSCDVSNACAFNTTNRSIVIGNVYNYSDSCTYTYNYTINTSSLSSAIVNFYVNSSNSLATKYTIALPAACQEGNQTQFRVTKNWTDGSLILQCRSGAGVFTNLYYNVTTPPYSSYPTLAYQEIVWEKVNGTAYKSGGSPATFVPIETALSAAATTSSLASTIIVAFIASLIAGIFFYIWKKYGSVSDGNEGGGEAGKT